MSIHLVSDEFAGVATKHVNVASDIFHKGVAFPEAFDLDCAFIYAIKCISMAKEVLMECVPTSFTLMPSG